MKRNSVTMASLLLLLLPAAISCTGQSNSPLHSQKDKIAYSLGVQVGQDLLRQDLDLNSEALLHGLRDGMRGSEPLLTDEEIEEVRQAFVEERQAARLALAEKTLAEGEAFLRENAGKEGVVTLPSGLQYRVLVPGEGASPKPEDNVKAHYTVRTIAGAELESTYKSGQPAVFPVTGVIPAWTEALPQMKEGAKWELYVPAALAYGEEGVSDVVGPNQALIFEIELIAIH